MDWKNWLKTRYSAKTAAAYAREITHFLLALPQASTADYQGILSYIKGLREHQKPACINRQLQSVKKYYLFLQQSGLREDNPAFGIRLLDGRRNRDIQLQDLLSETELELLWDFVKNKNYRYKAKKNRFLCLFSLLLFQGLTTEELCALRPENLNLEAAKIEIGATKSTMGRTLPLMAMQMLALQELCESADEYLFTGLNADNLHYLVSSIRPDFLKGKRLNPLRIRQSLIASKFEQGWDLRKVQLFAGHRYPSSTEAYCISGLESLLRTVERCHPLG